MKSRLWLTLFIASLFSQTATAMDLEIPGTGDGMELLREVAAAYNTDKRGTAVIIPPSTGSGGAVTSVGSDRTVLGRVARPLSEKEKEAGLVYAPIMRIPSAFYVHPGAGVSNLTSEQLAGIFSGVIHNWNEVGGTDLRVRVVRREEADSTLSVLRSSIPGWKDLKLTARSKLAMTTQEAIETVRDVEGTIAFGPYSRVLDATSSVLRVDGKHPIDEGYPSSATLALIYKEGRLTPDAEAFLNFASSARAHALMKNWGGLPVHKAGSHVTLNR